MTTYITNPLVLTEPLPEFINEKGFNLEVKGRNAGTLVTIGDGSLSLLRNSLSSKAEIITQDSDKYAESVKRWSAAAEKNAAMVVFPACDEDVSRAVMFAAAYELELAVKCGGHATSASSSTEGGICIDLSKMRAVQVDKEKKIITCQGGALWSDIYAAGQKNGLACVGGSVDHTGVAGLTLGGGYGYLQGEHGLVIDNLLEVKMILADGRLTKASKTVNPDLFWAIRGAGASFGIATSFSFQAHDQENSVWGGSLTFSSDKLESVVNTMNHLMTLPDEKNAMFLGFTSRPDHKLGDELILFVHLYYNGLAPVAEEFYQPLLRLGYLENTTGVKSYAEINKLPGTEHGLRRSMKGSAFIYPLSLELASSVLNEMTSFVREVPDAGNSMVLFEYFRHNKVASVPQTATAFANRGDYSNFLCIVGWTKEENDEKCRAWTRKMSSMTRREFEKKKEELEVLDENTRSGVGEYFNYDGIGSSGKTVFGINFPRLVTLKKKYDPKNIFSKGPQLLSK